MTMRTFIEQRDKDDLSSSARPDNDIPVRDARFVWGRLDVDSTYVGSQTFPALRSFFGNCGSLPQFDFLRA
jgi:hypothetical protein